MKVYIIQPESKDKIFAVAMEPRRADVLRFLIEKSEAVKTIIEEYETEDYDQIHPDFHSWSITFREDGSVRDVRQLARLCGEYFCDAKGVIDIFVKTNLGQEDALRIATKKREEYLSQNNVAPPRVDILPSLKEGEDVKAR